MRAYVRVCVYLLVVGHSEEVELLAGRKLPGLERHVAHVGALDAAGVSKGRLHLAHDVEQRVALEPHVPPDKLRVRLPPAPANHPSNAPSAARPPSRCRGGLSAARHSAASLRSAY